MNFTSDIKKEITLKRKKSFPESEAKAALSAFIRTSGAFGVLEGTPTFFIVSETENVAEFFSSVFFDLFGVELAVTVARMDKMSGRDKLVLQCPVSFSAEALKELKLLNADGKGFLENIYWLEEGSERERLAFIEGAFLGGGSCTVPTEGGRSGYHLEFVFPERKLAEEFCELLDQTELIARLVERKETFVAYIKSKEAISDFLALIEADKSLKKLEALMEKRDEANRNNRAANCVSGNADKTATAAVKQVIAIQKLVEHGKMEELSDELKELAFLRLKDRTKSLQELAERLGVSKSCLSHRMRRLIELANDLDEKK